MGSNCCREKSRESLLPDEEMASRGCPSPTNRPTVPDRAHGVGHHSRKPLEDDGWSQKLGSQDGVAIIKPQGGPQGQCKADRLVKILLLGAAESGKSTLMRHIQIIQGTAFSTEAMLRLKHAVRLCALECFEQFISDEHVWEATTSQWRTECDLFRQEFRPSAPADPAGALTIERQVMDRSVRLWKDPVIQEFIAEMDQYRGVAPATVARRDTCMDKVFINSTSSEKSSQGPPVANEGAGQGNGRGSLKYHSDNPALHFLPSFDRIMRQGYRPTAHDIISVRQPTNGVVEVSFQEGPLTIKLIDVGGQRTERRKWLHCFESINAVLFVTAMSEYDQMLMEDSAVCRTHESLKLFGNICNIRWFANAAMLLFFNKKDVFAEKIAITPLSVCFPNYKGINSYEEAAAYISMQFALQNHLEREVYRHFTCAKDQQNIIFVFEAVSDILIRCSIKYVGLY